MWGEKVSEPGAGGVGSHRRLNFQREGEGVAALASGDLRGAAGAHGVEEGLDFEAERLAGGDFWFGEAKAG